MSIGVSTTPYTTYKAALGVGGLYGSDKVGGDGDLDTERVIHKQVTLARSRSRSLAGMVTAYSLLSHQQLTSGSVSSSLGMGSG